MSDGWEELDNVIHERVRLGILTYLLQKHSSLELKKAEALSRFRIIDPIYTDPAPAKPKKALIAIVGMITALILAIFLVFFMEFLRGSDERKETGA